MSANSGNPPQTTTPPLPATSRSPPPAPACSLKPLQLGAEPKLAAYKGAATSGTGLNTFGWQRTVGQARWG